MFMYFQKKIIGNSVYFSFCLQQKIFVNHGEFVNSSVRSCLKAINVHATRGFTWSQMDLPADHSVSVVSAKQIVIFHTCQYWYFNCIFKKLIYIIIMLVGMPNWNRHMSKKSFIDLVLNI